VIERRLAASVTVMLLAAACSSGGAGGLGSDGGAPDSDAGEASGDASRHATGSDAGRSQLDATSASDAAPSDWIDAAPSMSDDGGSDCSIACDKAVDCGIASQDTCVCPAASKLAACAQCWVSHTCDELKNYACFSACN
jgi:hypothetical protein